MNDNGDFLYDNDYTVNPVEDYFLDNSITDDMKQPDPVDMPSEEDNNANA